MDDPNYKMKNIYSSVSPSEIALRCTILDLCQRLKRTEVLCDYYEQCRNELVSDCIRLRQERDYYLMAHRNSLQRSEACKPKSSPSNNNSNPTTGPPVDTNQLRQSTKIQPSFSFEKEIDFSKTSEPDDNYEQIAKRLIAQFREEMEEIRRTSLNGPQQQSTSSNQNVTMASGSHISKGRPQTIPTNHPVDSSTMPTMLAISPITPARQSSQQTASNCDDVSNSTKLLSDVPGSTSSKPPPSTPPVTSTVYLSKKMVTPISTTNDPTINCEYGEKIVIYDVIEDVQRGGGGGRGGSGSGVIGGSRYYQSNQGITKKDSTSEAIDKLSSPHDVSSTSSSAYNRNQHQQGHHHSPHQPYHHNRQRIVNSNNGIHHHQKEIENPHDLRDVPTVIEVNSNRDNYINPIDGGYERGGSGGDVGENVQGSTPSTNTEAEQYIDLCNKLLKSSINDFDTLTRMLMNQNEKLRKLKGKQLRNYFKRQLDQNNETSNLPKRP